MPSAGIAAFLIGITIVTVFYFFFPSSEDESGPISAHHVGRLNSSNRDSETQALSYINRRRRSQGGGVCSICLESLTSGLDVRVVLNPCKHIFHARCISEWVAAANEASCPNCRGRFL